MQKYQKTSILTILYTAIKDPESQHSKNNFRGLNEQEQIINYECFI